MNIKGLVYKIKETHVVSDKFKKRDLIITTDEQYPQNIVVEFHQDKTSLLDTYKTGDTVNLSLNVRGRLWTSPQGEEKCFNTLVCWRIESGQQDQAPPAQPQPTPLAPLTADEEGDIPF